MRKHFNLFYIFSEEKQQMQMSEEKNAEIWKSIEKLFQILSHRKRELPEKTKNN